MGTWADFFVAELGAAAPLTGLVIVGISVNVSRILSDKVLPGRAIETLVTPTGILIASTYALVPSQPALVFGWEIIGTGAAMWLVPTYIQMRAHAHARGLYPLRPRFLLTQFSSLPFIAAGLL